MQSDLDFWGFWHLPFLATWSVTKSMRPIGQCLGSETFASETWHINGDADYNFIHLKCNLLWKFNFQKMFTVSSPMKKVQTFFNFCGEGTDSTRVLAYRFSWWERLTSCYILWYISTTYRVIVKQIFERMLGVVLSLIHIWRCRRRG